MRTLIPILLFLLIVSPSLSQISDNEVLVWGVYIDMQDPHARDVASKLSKTGYSVEWDMGTDPPHLVLVPGDPGVIGTVLRKKKRDGIRVNAFNEGMVSGCPIEEPVKDSLIHYKYIRNNFINQYAIQAEDHVPDLIQSYGETAVSRYLGIQIRRFGKYLKGKPAPEKLDDYAWAMLGIPLEEKWVKDAISFDVILKKEKIATLRFDTLRGERMERFNAVETGKCGPFDRQSIFTELYGLGPDRFKPMRYVPRSEDRFSRVFVLNFEKNKANYTADDVKEIIDLMRDQSLSIQRASVEGYASVEGSLENNSQLMQQRANVLMDVLQRNNDEWIELDTVIVNESWEQFENQLKSSPHAQLLNKDREEIRETLNNSDSLLILLEPYLRQQRRAALKLSLGRQLDEQEKVEYVIRDMDFMIQLVCDPTRIRINFDPRERLFAIFDYAETLLERDLIDKSDFLSSIPRSEIMTEVLFYKALSDYEHKGEISELFDIESVIREANYLFMKMYEDQRKGQKKYGCLLMDKDLMNMLTDVHDLGMKLIKAGILPSDFMNIYNYPETTIYYPIILHHLHTLKKWMDEGYNLSASFDEVLPIVSGDPRFYYMIKKIVLEGDESILKTVYRSDHLLEFDLAYLLQVNIAGWEPEFNEYFDPDIDKVMMKAQLRRLISISKSICPRVVDQLNLDFHLKNLNYYLDQGFDPENKVELADLAGSIALLRRYAQTHIEEIPEEELLGLSRQLLLMDAMYLTRDGSSAAHDILNLRRVRKGLSDEAFLDFLRLAYYHNESFIQLVGQLEDPCVLFKGPNGMIPYGDLKNSICQKCN